MLEQCMCELPKHGLSDDTNHVDIFIRSPGYVPVRNFDEIHTEPQQIYCADEKSDAHCLTVRPTRRPRRAPEMAERC